MASQLQKVTAALRIELFRQWQTYDNGVHMKADTFAAIDFESLAASALQQARDDGPHGDGPNVDPVKEQG